MKMDRNGHRVFKTWAVPLVLMIAGLHRILGNIGLSILAGTCIYAAAALAERI